MKRFQRALDRLHAGARSVPALHRLAIISRISLALAFIPTGAVKALGERFTLMGTETPIGYFFETMYQSGFYWNFLGWSQVIALRPPPGVPARRRRAARTAGCSRRSCSARARAGQAGISSR